jgi:parallel beta-helix repeat protein
MVRKMTLKSKVSISVCVLLVFSICICSVQVPAVHSWGWDTHQFIENEAEGILSKNYPSFSTFLSDYHDTLYAWCIMPDQNPSFMPDGGGKSDWHYLDAHSYNPLVYTGGELPWAMEWIFDNIVQYLKDGNWDTAAQLMGAICHFTGDATMPLHSTYNYTPGGNHGAYESTVNNEVDIDNISIPDNYVPQELGNVFDAAMATLENSFSFTREGSNGGVNLTDFLENGILWNDWIKSMTENRVRAAVQFTANIWYTAMVRAGLVIGSVATLSPHSPIYIDSNAGFTAANGVTSGSGTENDPYIIENWSINASSANGIEIKSTDVYFVIRNCLVENGGVAYYGIYLDNVVNGEVKNATIENNRNGIYLIRSENNDVIKCDISNQFGEGIRLDLSNNNIISGCNISNSSGTGLALENSSNDLVYHNNFENNQTQALDSGGTNSWDNGYPSGGNYWSDYTGVDNHQGENQNASGGDGIGDTPYKITGNANQDRYPLMKPWTPAGPITTPEVLVGVKVGDWIKLDFTINGASSGTTLPQWEKVEFINVDGTNITVRTTRKMLDGTEQSDNITFDVATGGGTFGGPRGPLGENGALGPPGENGAIGPQGPPGENMARGAGFFMMLSRFVIPANSKTGDSIKMINYNTIKIAGENSRTYGGVSRTVVYASSSQRGDNLTYYWDKQTGAIVEVHAVSGDVTETGEVTETNIWQTGGTNPTRWPLIVGFVGAIVVIGIAILLFMMRLRRRNWP